MVKVIALKSHSPDGNKRYKTGQSYRISAAAAQVLCALKFVRIDVDEESDSVKSDKKKYQRRDMRAEE